MIEPWTGEIVAELHINHISQTELAREIGCTPQYVSMALSGTKKSSTIEQRMREAIARIVDRRTAENDD